MPATGVWRGSTEVHVGSLWSLHNQCPLNGSLLSGLMVNIQAKPPAEELTGQKLQMPLEGKVCVSIQALPVTGGSMSSQVSYSE